MSTTLENSTKAQRIVAYLQLNPIATTSDIVEVMKSDGCEVSPGYVRSIRRRESTRKRKKWDVVELAGLIAALFALAAWVTKANLVEKFEARVKMVKEMEQIRSSERLYESIERSQQNNAKVSIRLEEMVGRLVLISVPEEGRERVGRLLTLMNAMEHEQWAQNWTEDVISWQTRLVSLKEVETAIECPPSLVEKIDQKLKLLSETAMRLGELRGQFQVEKRRITGMESFDAKSIAEEDFVPQLIKAFENHRKHARNLHLAAFGQYSGTGDIERELLQVARDVKASIQKQLDIVTIIEYILLMLAGAFTIIGKVMKLIIPSESEDD